MDLKQMSEVGLSAVAEGIAKVREAIPEDALAKAEETLAKAEDALSKDSPLGKQVLGIVSAATAHSETARERAAEAATVAKQRAAEAAAVAREKSAEAAAVAKERSAEAAAAAREKSAELATAARETDAESTRSRRTFWKVAAGTVVTAAAVGTGYALWRRRTNAATPVEPEPAPAEETEIGPGLAEVESPESEDPELAEEIDEVADELATEMVEAVEGEHAAETEPPAPAEESDRAEELAPGLADVESPDAEDPSFAEQVDAAADEIAEDIIEAVEEPKHD